MEFFLPSVFLIMLAFFVSMYLIPKSSIIILGGLSLLLLVFAVYNHYSFFANEYRIMTWADTAKKFAPTLLVTLVIIMMIGYLLFATGIKSSDFKLPPTMMPSANSATNPVTTAINNGLSATGMTNSASDTLTAENIQKAKNAGLIDQSALNMRV